MQEKLVTVTLSEVRDIREIFPEVTYSDAIAFKKRGTLEDIRQFKAMYPKLGLRDAKGIMTYKAFINWIKQHDKAIIAIALPIALYQAYAFNAGLGAATMVYVPHKAAGKVSLSFFGGKGAILLHMLVVGFFTLVVSSFLKFTGRGDLIPLVMFVGGAVILYEVIGLFNDIYLSIKTLMQM